MYRSISLRRLALIATVVLSAMALAPRLAAAASGPRLLSVLPLDVASTTLTPQDKASLEEAVRTIAGDVLAPSGITVLTNDTQLELLAENGIDPNRACDASCHLEAARELKASWFVSGVIVPESEEYVAFIRLYDTATGRQLSSAQIEGANIRELRRSFNDRAEAFFSRAALVESPQEEPEPAPPSPQPVPTPPSPSKPPVQERGGYLDIVLSPPHATVSIGGVRAHAGLNGPLLPGPHRVSAHAERYQPAEVVAMIQDQVTTSVTLSLAPLTPPVDVPPVDVRPADWRAPRPPTPRLDPIPSLGTPWTRTFLGLGPGYVAWEIGGRGHWAFRIGVPELSARWYQNPHGNGAFITVGLPVGIGYQWMSEDGSVVQVGFPQLLAVGF